MQLLSKLDTYSDQRGDIRACLPDNVNIKSVLHITGVKGAVRANHWHKKDTHYCYVVSGVLRYTYINENKDKVYILMYPGECVFTPAEEVHKFEFVEAGAFIAMATEPRDSESYESDTFKQII